jgi:hypothetical protein
MIEIFKFQKVCKNLRIPVYNSLELKYPCMEENLNRNENASHSIWINPKRSSVPEGRMAELVKAGNHYRQKLTINIVHNQISELNFKFII